MKTAKEEKKTIGIISDTHGLVRPGVYEVFKGVDTILHAGDIDTPAALEALETIAPVKAVRGNMDGNWAAALPETDIITIGSVSFYMLHDLYQMDLDPAAAGVRVVISGHTHKPHQKKKENILYLNPGSAGPRRYNYPVTVMLMDIDQGVVTPRLVSVEV